MQTFVEGAESAAPGRDQGFSLVELLVVVIIIGILAAIAIPVFLIQRDKAHDAAEKSDLANLAVAEEAYLTDSPGGYTADVPLLEGNSTYGFKQTANVEMAVNPTGGSGFCAAAYNTVSQYYWFYDSENGGLDPVADRSGQAPNGGACAGGTTTSWTWYANGGSSGVPAP